MNVKKLLRPSLVFLVIVAALLFTKSVFAGWQDTPLTEWTEQMAIDARSNEWSKFTQDLTPIAGPNLPLTAVPQYQTLILITSSASCTTSAGTYSQSYQGGNLYIFLLRNGNSDQSANTTISCEGLPVNGASFGFYRMNEIPDYNSIVGLPLIQGFHCGYDCVLAKVSEFFDGEDKDPIEQEYLREDMLYAKCENPPPGYICKPPLTPTFTNSPAPTETPTSTATPKTPKSSACGK